MILWTKSFYLAVAALVFIPAAELIPVAGDGDTAEKAPEESRIVGGQIAKIGQIPHQASIRYDSQYSTGHFCGGTIIDNRHILTAAHCARIMFPLKEFYVAVGSISLTDKKQIKKYTLCDNIINLNFSPMTLRNDIAILKTCKKIKYCKTVKPKKITKSEPEEGTNCTISGWGTWESGEDVIHDELKVATVPISNMDECVANYTGEVDPKTMICAGYKQGGVDTCQGDSGGPLICNGKLAGIVSWGNGCALPGYPGIYTNIYNLRNWLKKHKINVKMDDENEAEDVFDEDIEDDDDEDDDDDTSEENSESSEEESQESIEDKYETLRKDDYNLLAIAKKPVVKTPN